MISLSDFSSIINPKWPVTAAFISFSGTWYGQKTFDLFSEWKPRFQSFSVVILTRSKTYRHNKTTQNYSHLREGSHHLLLINIFGSLSPVSSINSFPPNGILGYLLGKKMALVIAHLVTYNRWLRGWSLERGEEGYVLNVASYYSASIRSYISVRSLHNVYYRQSNKKMLLHFRTNHIFLSKKTFCHVVCVDLFPCLRTYP